MNKLIIIVFLLTLPLLLLAKTEAQTPGQWQNVTPNGLAARGIAADPSHPGWVYAGLQIKDVYNSGGQGIWKSTNYGATWGRVDQPWAGDCGSFNGIPMSLAVGSNGTVWAVNVYGCDQGVLRSTDGGVNWTNTKVGDFNNVSVDASNPNHIIAGYHSRHDICNDPCDTGIVESLDGGSTWRTTATVAGAGWSQWAHFVTPTTWLVLGHAGGLYRTDNSGASWTRVAAFAGTIFSGDIILVNGAVYVGFDQGILRSTDNGLNWTHVLLDTSPDEYNSFAADPTGRIYTHSAYPFGGYGGGPYKTSTDGVNWSNLNAQNFSNGPAHMASDSQYIYSANWNLGLWRYQINGGPPSTPTTTPTSTPQPPSTPTVPPTSSPSATVSPSPSPSSTPSPGTCEYRVKRNGLELWVTKPYSDCDGAHP